MKATYRNATITLRPETQFEADWMESLVVDSERGRYILNVSIDIPGVCASDGKRTWRHLEEPYIKIHVNLDEKG